MLINGAAHMDDEVQNALEGLPESTHQQQRVQPAQAKIGCVLANRLHGARARYHPAHHTPHPHGVQPDHVPHLVPAKQPRTGVVAYSG